MMNPHEQFCPNPQCGASGQSGAIGVHSQKDQRYQCKRCGKTFSATTGTAYAGLKKEAPVFTVVITLLAYGCPAAAIVAAYGLDVRTVRQWLLRAGEHCQAVHEYAIDQFEHDLQHIQADELKLRTQKGVVWMALVLMVSTRLWLGGAVGAVRDQDLLKRALGYARRCALCRALLVAVDGLTLYGKAIRQTFRSSMKVGRGRARWFPWQELQIVQVMHSSHGHRQDGWRTHILQGEKGLIARLIRATQGRGGINTAFIERLNATFRQRLACLTRRTRHLARQVATLEASMFLLGCVYNLCSEHTSLTVKLWLTERRTHRVQRTPAMAAGWTDHCWSVQTLLSYKVPPRGQRHSTGILLPVAASPRYSV